MQETDGVKNAGLLLPFSPSVLSLEFDLFQRYSSVATYLDRLLVGTSTPVTVLEAGCSSLNLLPQFLDAARVKVTRCDIAGDAGAPGFVLVEKDKPFPFADGAFDAVAALEVLEHMPAASRSGFVRECVRVAKHGVVFTAPNGVQQARDYEDLWHRAYTRRHGTAHKWLLEHAQFGLPSEEDVIGILKDSGHPFRVYDHVALDVWLAMMMLSDSLHGGALTNVQLQLNEAYLAGALVGSPVPYRKIFVVAKTDSAAGALQAGTANTPAAQTHAAPKELEPLDLLATAVTGMLGAIEREREGNAERESSLAAQKMEVRLLERVLETVCKSGSWKLGRPLRVLRRVLLSQRFHLDTDLRSPDLRPVTWAPAGTWVAGGFDPQFVIPCLASRGWLRIRLKMVFDTDGLAELYFDTGAGFSPAQKVSLPHTCGPFELDRLIPLGEPIRAVRFDPVSSPGQFRIEHFSVTVEALLPALVRSCWGKFQELRTAGRFGRGMRTAASLLLHGKFGEFKQKLFSRRTDAGSGPTWYLPALTEAEQAEMRGDAAHWTDPPLISVLLPVYNPPERYLRLAIESVLKQIYPHWELCIADDCSSAPHVARVIQEYAARDKRIKTVVRTQNGNISAASNSALELATGQYTALLDHDDELAAQALFRAAEALMNDRALDMIYSDEDKLTVAGQHVDPFFKPDWSPEYFLSCMYTCHLGVYRTALLRELGGFRSQYDFAQDYDLVLRLTARTSRIRHIPEVLYHWRVLPTSTASGHTAKPKAHLVAQQALQDHINAIGRQGTVEAGPVPGYHRVRYSIAGRPRVSIIVASACRRGQAPDEQPASLGKCVASIRAKSSYTDYEILALHNYALPPAAAQQAEQAGAKVIVCDTSLNAAGMLNVGAAKAGGTHLVFLHDDIEVLALDWIQCLLECAQDDGVGVVGAKLLFPDGRLSHVGLTVLDARPKRLFQGARGDTPGYFNSNLVHRNLSAVSAACLLTRADVFRAVGGFTPAFAAEMSDADYCLKVIDAGKRVVLSPYAQLCHHEQPGSDGASPREAAEFQRRWAAKYGRDPFFPALAQRDAGLC